MFIYKQPCIINRSKMPSLCKQSHVPSASVLQSGRNLLYVAEVVCAYSCCFFLEDLPGLNVITIKVYALNAPGMY
jgi:hypothetical protein